MIKIDHLVKHFGDKKAVNDISFSVEEGEIVIKVTKTEGCGRFDKIVKMIEESEKMKSEQESKAERITRYTSCRFYSRFYEISRRRCRRRYR